MSLGSQFSQNQFDPAAYQAQLIANNRNVALQRIAEQEAMQQKMLFDRQQRALSEVDASIQGTPSGEWYTDKAFAAAQQMPQQGLPQQQPMPQAQPQQQMPPQAPAGGQMPVQQPPVPQQQMPQRQQFTMPESLQWAQQQEDRQRKIIDGHAAKYLDIVSKAQETNPQLANKIGAQLKKLPGWELVGEAVEQTKFGVPNQKIVFGSQISKLSPAEKAALGEMSPEALAQIGPTDTFKLKRTGNSYSLIEYRPDPRDSKRIVKTEMVDGKPTNVMYNYKGEKITDLGTATSGSTGGRYVATDDEVQHWANAIREGRMTIDKVPAYGGLRARVQPAVERAMKNNEPVHYMGDIAGAKSAASSQSFVTKQLDMSQSFISTIDANIDQFKEHIRDMSERKNIEHGKLMNMGVRTYLKSVAGDSDINIYDMLVNAISTETAKLVSGGAGSVGQVAEGARIEMDKIHDKNMPIKDMLKLLEATRREGGNRITALEKQLGTATKRTRTTRPIDGSEPATGNSRKTKEQILGDFMRANPKAPREAIMNSPAYLDAVRKYGAK